MRGVTWSVIPGDAVAAADDATRSLVNAGCVGGEVRLYPELPALGTFTVDREGDVWFIANSKGRRYGKH